MDDATKRTVKQRRHKHRMLRRRTAGIPEDLCNTIAAWQQRPAGQPLATYAAHEFSQHGEDGMTVEVFRRIGAEHRRAVEIGCGANGGNAGILVAGLGFSALLMDGNKRLTAICRDRFASCPVTVRQAWIAREMIGQLLDKHGFGCDLDYLGIDLDGIDYWIWNALDVRPRLVIVEYNQLFGPDAAVTVAYTPDFSRKALGEDGRHRYPKNYWGASLAAFDTLGRSRGYRLIGTCPNSPNAYFLRDDVAGDIPTVPVAEAWAPRTKSVEGRWGKGYTVIHEAGLLHYFARRGAPLVEVD